MNDAPADLLMVAQALALLDATPVQLRIVKVKLEDAQGLRLATNLHADRDYPPFDKSLMDGFAVRCADVQNTPVELQVIGEIAAGQRTRGTLRAGQAFAIMTGAPLPSGTDGVVPVEDTQFDKQASKVRILQSTISGRFIAKQGSDCADRAGVLYRGTKLEAAQLAVAASVGASLVDVYAKPRAAVLSTGDELVAVDATPGEAQIRNSNNIMLVALLRRLGCEVTDLGAVRDDPKLIREAIERGLQFDVLFVSGGMSMGQYDFVPKVLIEIGVELKITKLRIKPGKPFIFGVRRESFAFGLPGNPVSSFVCTLRLCSRLIARMAGGSMEKWTRAALESPLEQNGPREFYQPAILNRGTVKPLKWKGSADIYTLAMANALIVRAENAPPLAAGAEVEVLEVPS